MRFFRGLARGLLSALLALLLAEAALRIAGKKYSASLYTADAERGFALRPNARGWAVDEGENYVVINSQGMRDREHALPRPAGTLRIAVLGDSAAEARQVPLEKTFVAVTEARLNACRKTPVEVLNFAVPGYSLAQQYLTLKSKVWRYDPQVIVLAMYMGNAIINSSRLLSTSATPGVPFFELRDGALAPDRETHQALIDARKQAWRDRIADLTNRSRLFLMANEARLVLARKWKAWRSGAASSSSLPARYMGTWPYLPPMHPAMREAWAVSEKLIAAIRDEATSHHAELWIVTLDMPMQVHPDAKVREEFRRRIGAESLSYADERIAALGSREGIPVVTLAPELRRYAEAHHLYLHGFLNTPLNSGHWNEAGNRAAGELLARRLCAELP